MAEKINVYDLVTENILAQLKQGTIPWHKPWAVSNDIRSMAFNRFSKKAYSMLNQWLLPLSGEYATFKQWLEIGGKVKKGAKAHIVVFWKMNEYTDRKTENGEEVLSVRTIPTLKYYNVFHISEVEGVEPLTAEQLGITETVKNTFECHEEVEKVFADYLQRESIKLLYGGNSAFYSPDMDFIQLPEKERFDSFPDYVGTLAHECIHSTGAKNRLCRELSHMKEEYSKEELVAQIGSEMSLKHFGIDTEHTRKNTASYVGSWLSVLKNDTKFIVSAASQAEKAFKFLLFGERPMLSQE